MNKNTLSFGIIISIVSIFIIIQSVLYPLILKINFLPEISLPDLSLIAIVYFSINYGKIVGESIGFTTGLILDALSGATFGLNSLVRLVIGYFLGFFKGKIFLDKIILPVVMITVTTTIKYVLFHVVEFIFPIDINVSLISVAFIEELGFNIVLTPIMFSLFQIITKKIIRV